MTTQSFVSLSKLFRLSFTSLEHISQVLHKWLFMSWKGQWPFQQSFFFWMSVCTVNWHNVFCLFLNTVIEISNFFYNETQILILLLICHLLKSVVREGNFIKYWVNDSVIEKSLIFPATAAGCAWEKWWFNPPEKFLCHTFFNYQ